MNSALIAYAWIFLPPILVASLPSAQRPRALLASGVFALALVALHSAGVLLGMPAYWSFDDVIHDQAPEFSAVVAHQVFGTLWRHIGLAFLLGFVLVKCIGKPARFLASLAVALPAVFDFVLATVPIVARAIQVQSVYVPEVAVGVLYPAFGGVAGFAAGRSIERR